MNDYGRGFDLLGDPHGRRRAERRSNAALDVPPTPDIAALESAGDALMRHREMRHAIALYAIALRLRGEANA